MINEYPVEKYQRKEDNMDFNLLINNISNLLITFITIIFSAYIMFTEMYLNRYANKIIKARDLTISIGACVALIVLNSVIVSLNYGIIKGIVACLAVIGTVYRRYAGNRSCPCRSQCEGAACQSGGRQDLLHRQCISEGRDPYRYRLWNSFIYN